MGMDDHTKAKLDAFRSLARKTETLHAELASLDAAVSDLDAIKERIDSCRDEAEARQLLAEFREAEDTVTIKRIRQTRLREELAATTREAEFAYFDAITVLTQLTTEVKKAALEPLDKLLRSLQPEELNRKRDEANKVALSAVSPSVHAEEMGRRLGDVWKEIGIKTNDPYGPAKNIRHALETVDHVLARIPELQKEAKRNTAACEAFRKAYAKT